MSCLYLVRQTVFPRERVGSGYKTKESETLRSGYASTGFSSSLQQFQGLEEQRVAYLRHQMWTYSNLCSQATVIEDEVRRFGRKRGRRLLVVVPLPGSPVGGAAINVMLEYRNRYTSSITIR